MDRIAVNVVNVEWVVLMMWLIRLTVMCVCVCRLLLACVCMCVSARASVCVWACCTVCLDRVGGGKVDILKMM